MAVLLYNEVGSHLHGCADTLLRPPRLLLLAKYRNNVYLRELYRTAIFMNKIQAELCTGSTTLKAALTTGFLSLPIAALPIAAGIIHSRIAQTQAATWILTLAILYARYVSAAPEPLLLVMVGWGMILFSRVARSTVALHDGRVLVTGGGNGRSAEVYDPTTATWREVGDMTSVRQKHAAALLPDGRVLITGGAPDGHWHPLRTAEIFDPHTNRFTAVADMELARFKLPAATASLRNGAVLRRWCYRG